MQAQQSSYRPLRVSAIIDETHDAKSIVFAAPPSGSGFDYRPGQFLTLRVPTGQGQVARCYSLASAPALGEPMKVTVKRVSGGAASNWLCDRLQAGDELEVMPPAGVFCPRTLDGDLLLLAGGSGITPVMSILKSALHGGTGRIVLVYANRDERSVIFAQELRELAREFPQRLTVHHWLESVQGLPGMGQLAELVRPYAGYEAFICGPGPYMDCAASALNSLGFPRQRVHIERFVSLSNDPGAAPAAAPVPEEQDGEATALEVVLDGQTHTLDWRGQASLLDAMLGAGLDAPHSCREGKCSACICKVVDGRVAMSGNFVLTPADLAEGYVLACRAMPDSAAVRVCFDE